MDGEKYVIFIPRFSEFNCKTIEREASISFSDLQIFFVESIDKSLEIVI